VLIALWILTLFALGLWSLTAWGLHAVLTLDAARLGDLKPLIDQIPYGALISQWLPGWQDWLRASIDLTQMLLGWVGGAAPVIVWVLWGVGTIGLLIVAVVLTFIIRRLWGRSSPPGGSGRPGVTA
jgi:hypothetical protein